MPSLTPSSPGDPRLPVSVGRIEDFARDPVGIMRGLWARHGEVAALQEDTQRLYFVFGPTYTRQVLSDAATFHAVFFAIRGPRKSAQRRVTSGLLSMNGETHRRHRRMVMEPFQKKAIGAYVETIDQIADEMLADWQPGQVRDINDDMTRYMLRLTSCILFGLDQADLADRIGRLTERWVELNHRIGPAALTPNPMLTAQYDDLLEAAEELEASIKEMIAIRRSGKLGYDVLSLLLRAHDTDGSLTDEQLIGHIALLFGAAHLTSAHTLTWTLLLLSQHPQVMADLHEELTRARDNAPLAIRAASGCPFAHRSEPAPHASAPASFDDLPVLDRVLKESMRVLPASAYSQRMVAQPVQLGPFRLSHGSMVIFSQFLTHHLPNLYEQPERFLPERWESISPSPYAYLPFGAGPRMCIGAALGMMQLKRTLPAILSRFKLNLVQDAEITGRVQSTMLYPIGRVPMLVAPQDGRFFSWPIKGNIHSLVDLPPASIQIGTTTARAA